MRKQAGLTRVDVAVALACIALVVGQAAVLNAGGRERAKREVCLANLRMLTAAWKAYADDNAGKLVNGAPQTGIQCPDCSADPAYRTKAAAPTISSDEHYKEVPWIGPAYGAINDCSKKCAINTGALWKYANDYDIYRCPVGNKGEMITYMIVDGANGLPRQDTKVKGVWLKNINQIKKTAKQLIFIDEGKVSPDSYAVNFDGGSEGQRNEVWWDPPPVRHEGGVTVSFADGHSEHHKWKAKETIIIGGGGYYPMGPTTCAGKNDLYWVQTGCWGKLGYTPSCPVNIE
jgi:prepilin-type processing-associated H-X9-DG protein